MGKNVIIGGRIHNPEVGNVALGANEVLDDTKGKKQNVINAETDAELLRLENEKQDNLTFDQAPTEDSTNPVTSGGVYAADAQLQAAIEAILILIPSAASALNQLADKSFVNSTVATATATFRGTYNVVTDLGLEFDATHEQIAAALLSHIATADNNDYAFVQIPVSATSTDIRVTERYKFNGTAWAYEYDLNNSGFTALQWAAINSGITALLVEKLGALPTAAELALALAGKQATLTFDNAPVAGSNNPVKSGGLYELFTAIDAKMPAGASANNKLVAEDRLAAYVSAIIEALDASFDLTSADGHITFRMTQTNGVIASVQILTSDIASASALSTLAGRVSTNETDISNLQQLYNDLQQSKPVPVTSLPTSGQQQGVIYRLAGNTSYADYMWNGSSWVMMAEYNNAIDSDVTKGSTNLITNNGVYEGLVTLHKPLFDNLIKYNEVLDAYIRNTDGAIVPGVGYKVFETYLPAGTYYIKLTYTGTQSLLCKYTDGTYETRESTIIGAIYGNYQGFKTLEAGYYAFGFTTNDSLIPYNDSYVFNVDRFLYLFNGSVPVTNNFNYRNLASIGSLNINDRYVGVVFQSELVGVECLKGYYINDSGAIVSASADYVLWKFQLTEGNYYLRLLNAYSHINLAKYTDNTYTTKQKTISSGAFEGTMGLEAGYYALVTTLSNAKDPAIMNVDKFKSAFLSSIKTLPLYYDSPISAGKYISDAGAIADAAPEYKLLKVHLPYDGWWVVGENLTNSHPVMAEYTDDTYSTLKGIAVAAKTSPYTKKIFLGAGYYAVCSSGNAPSVRYVNKDVVTDLCDFLEKRGNVGGVQNFADFTLAGWSKVSDNIIQSTGVGFENIAAYPYTTYEDDFILKVNVTPLTADANGYFSICFGKVPTTTQPGGTAIIVGKDANGNFVSVGHFQNGVYTEAVRTALPNMRVALNHALSITLQKGTDTRLWFKATVTDDRGNTLTTDKVYDMNSNFTTIVGGYGHGRPIMYAVVGTWKASDYSFGYPKDLSDIKLVIMGHSFVEGMNTTIGNREERFSAMLANDVGLKNTCIFGLGGGGINMLGGLQVQLSWLSTTKYALMCFGTNDTDTQDVADTYGVFDRMMKAWQITPIWMTVPPRADGTEKNLLNQYIKEHFNYVDITQIFYDDNGNIDTTYLAGDGVHPTVEGYERMYQIVKSQCAGFFEI